MTLTIESGPGELPTGRAIRFAPDSDIPIRDGQAAITMRSWQKGRSVLRASSPGLADAVLSIDTLSGPAFVPGVTPLARNRPYKEAKRTEAEFMFVPESVFGRDNPTSSSSTAKGHESRLVNDGDSSTWWQAAKGDAAPWVLISTEKVIQFRKLEITFPRAGNYRFVAQMEGEGGQWVDLVDRSASDETAQKRVVETKRLIGTRMRVKVLPPPGAPAGIAEISIIGAM